MQENVFVCEKVSKRYGSFQALKQVSFSVGKENRRIARTQRQWKIHPD